MTFKQFQAEQTEFENNNKRAIRAQTTAEFTLTQSTHACVEHFYSTKLFIADTIDVWISWFLHSISSFHSESTIDSVHGALSQLFFLRNRKIIIEKISGKRICAINCPNFISFIANSEWNWYSFISERNFVTLCVFCVLRICCRFSTCCYSIQSVEGDQIELLFRDKHVLHLKLDQKKSLSLYIDSKSVATIHFTFRFHYRLVVEFFKVIFHSFSLFCAIGKKTRIENVKEDFVDGTASALAVLGFF